jgi:hypothetical protein
VIANILHLAENMDDDLPNSTLAAPDGPAPPISAFVITGRNLHGGRGPNTRGGHGGRGFTNKCSACGSLNHIILSSYTSSYDALLKGDLVKHKMIIQKFGTPCGTAPHAALLSDVPTADPNVMPTLEECTYEYYDSEVSVPFSSVAFSSSLAPGRNLSQFWVIDSACSINLTTFRSDFVTFDPPSALSRVGGVGVDVKGGGAIRISLMLVSSQPIHRTVHAVYTLDMSYRSA